jgi:hypothetical protein
MSRGIHRSHFIAQQTAGSAIDVLGLIATDTNWTNRYRAAFINTFKPFSPQTHIQFSQLPTSTTNAFQPGGNCIINRGIPNAFCVSHDSDPYGRWATSTFAPSPTATFVYIVAYCPSTSTGHRGINTSWRQQFLKFEEMGISNPDPVKIFFSDLQHYIASQRTKGYEILLAIDANSHNDTPSNPMDRLMANTDMVDMILAKHPFSQGQPLPNTYNQGSQRIDFLCCTRNLLFAITRVGYDAFGEIYDSDHRGMTLDLDWSKLKGTNSPDDIRHTKSLSTRRKDHILSYKATLMQYFQQHNIPSRITTLQLALASPTDLNTTIALIESIDRDYTRAMLCAARACKGGYTTPFSSQVVNLRKIVGYWNLKWRHHRSTTVPPPISPGN